MANKRGSGEIFGETVNNINEYFFGIDRCFGAYEENFSDGTIGVLASMSVPTLGRKLIRIIYERRNREANEEERSRYIQQKAEEFGLE